MSWDKSTCYDDGSGSNEGGNNGGNGGVNSDNNERGDSKANCGNGFLDDGEQCDDGNRIDGDGCSKYCMKESGTKSSGCALTVF